MTSIIKVDTIQTSAGGTPTASSLGIGGVGKIGQVVSLNKTDSFTTTSTSMVDITGFSLSITPSSNTSKILVKVDVTMLANSGANGTYLSLLRDSTVLLANTDSGAADTYNAWVTSGGQTFTDNNRYRQSPSVSYLDSPSTTSSVTYKVQMQVDGSSTGYFNRWGVNNDHAGVASITLMEVLA